MLQNNWWLKYYEEAGDDGDQGGGSDSGGDTVSDTGGDPVAGDDTGGDVGDSGVQAKWPDNWRETYAGEDEKKLNALSRYQSPVAAFDALLSAQNRIRSGELRTPFPEKGTPEEQATWRQENGLPEAPDKYDLNFESGLTIGEEDKPFVDEFLKVAHESNLTNDQVKQSLEWYYQNQTAQAEARNQADEEVSRETIDSLHAEWGQDYKRNMNLIRGLMDTAPQEVQDNLYNARMPDGTPVFSDKATLQFLTQLALEVNPTATLVPSGTQNVTGNIEDQIAEIEKTMRTDRATYNRDSAMQERYRALLDAREKIQKRAS